MGRTHRDHEDRREAGRIGSLLVQLGRQQRRTPTTEAPVAQQWPTPRAAAIAAGVLMPSEATLEDDAEVPA